MWSVTKKKLEGFLCKSLKNRVRYFCTMYRHAHDGLGRAGIMVDNIEVLDCSAPKFDSKWADPSFVRVSDGNNSNASCPFEYWAKECSETGEKIYSTEAFFTAVDFFLSHSILESLIHHNEIVVVLALLDRRLGKRTLQNISANMKDASELVQLFYELRCKAEYF